MGNLAVDSKFWSGRRVLVTGHTGFKGSWLVYWLTTMGAIVTGYALDPRGEHSLFSAAKIGPRITDLRGNISDAKKIEGAILSFKPQTVFHLAAQPLVLASYEDPIETYKTNVLGTLNIYEAMRQLEQPCQIISVTSDKCYLNREWIWGYREDEALGGHDPYSASKACVEIISSSYRQSFFEKGDIVRLATVRAGNVIGGGDWASNRIVPDLIRGFFGNKVVSLRQPKSVRPFQHVLDALYGYLNLAQRLSEEDGANLAGAWNFGPNVGEEISVEEIAKLVQQFLNGKLTYVCEDGFDGHHEAKTLRLDTTKARRLLGWEPKYNTIKSVEATVEWYKKFYNQEGVEEVMDRQIRQFLKAV